jgi:hypothetical protein
MRQPPLDFDHARTVRADQPRLPALHRLLHADHVAHGNALGNGDAEVQAGIDALEDGIAGERGRDEHGAGGGAGLFRGLGHSVEDGHLLSAVLEALAALAGRDAGDDLRAVIDGELRVPRAEAAGDALDEDLGVGLNEDGHGKSVVSKR